jgi:hypothetical protein
MELVLPIPEGVPQYITRGYGELPTHQNHSGCSLGGQYAIWCDYYALDFAGAGCTSYESPVVAVAAGTVVLDGYYAYSSVISSYGNHVVIDHGNGCFSQYAHLDSQSVSNGEFVEQGQAIGRQGCTGNVSGASCSECPGAHLHFKFVCDGSATIPEPMSGMTGLEAWTGGLYRSEGYTHFPVGTLIQVPGRPEIYLVSGDDEVMHIPDWFTFTSHRFFYEPDRPSQRVVTVSQTALDCYNIVTGNSSWAEYELIDCNGTEYVLFRENGGGFVRHQVPFNPVVDLRYDPLLRSWGLDYSDLRDGTTNECNPSAPTGATLTMRPGTIVEEASENDFWVITDDSYRGDDVNRWFPSVRAESMCRYVDCPAEPDEDDEPFMPLVFGSYGLVIMIPDDTISAFVDTVSSAEFDIFDALSCPAASCSSGGGGASRAGSQPCNDTSQRACVNGTDYIYCEEVSVGVFEWSQPWPCGEGWECTNSEGQCTRVSDDCTPGSTICHGTTHDATCYLDPDTGLTIYVPFECPAGYECVEPNTECTEAPPGPNADPPHTIRCVNHDYTYSMFVTGPIQNGLWGTVSGQDVYLEYGSNSDGWSSYVPGAGSKPYSTWVGDADGLGNPYVHELAMNGNTDEINLFLYSPDSGEQEWFNLDWGIWTVTGDCHQEGTSIRHDPLPPPSGTITCTQEGGDMRYEFDGPMQMLLVNGAAAGPVEIQYGSNTDGWTVPTSGKTTAPWNGTYHHEIVLPTTVNGLNFYLHGSGGGRWFDLVDADWDGDQWTVTGDCWNDGGLIRH